MEFEPKNGMTSESAHALSGVDSLLFDLTELIWSQSDHNDFRARRRFMFGLFTFPHRNDNKIVRC